MFAFVISGFLLFFKCMLEERGQEKENEREGEIEGLLPRKPSRTQSHSAFLSSA